MEKVVKIIPLKQKQSDYDFWLTKNFKERLEAIELLRSQYIKFRKDVQPRLQRVCRIINQA
jgi:Arc/MetJ family transcription regulator